MTRRTARRVQLFAGIALASFAASIIVLVLSTYSAALS